MKKLKKIILIFLLILLLYVGPAIFNYWFIHVSYSEGGTRSKATPNWTSVSIVFWPVLNTAMSVVLLSDWPPYKREEEKKKDYKKFFKIK